MKVFLYLSSIITIVTQSCASNNKILTQNENFNFQFDTIYHNYSLDLTKKITGGIDLHVSDTSLTLMYNYCGNNQVICLYPQHDTYSTLSLRTNCQKVFTKKVNEGFYILNQEGDLSFYNLSEEAKIPPVLKVDLAGISGRHIANLKSDSVLWKLGLDIEQYKPGAGMHYHVADSTLYFRIMKSFDTDEGFYSKKNSDFPIFCKYNIITGEKRFFGSQPLSVERSWYGLCSKVYDLYIGDTIITSEGVNGKIKIINTKNNRIIETVVKSSYDTKPFKKFVLPGNLENAKTAKLQHFLQSPYYEAIYYNPFTNYYYRIFHPAMKKYNAQGLLNTSYDKSCVLMIIDKQFKLVDEVVIPLKATQAFQIHPVESGIELALPDLYEQTKKNSKFAFLKITHSNL